MQRFALADTILIGFVISPSSSLAVNSPSSSSFPTDEELSSEHSSSETDSWRIQFISGERQYFVFLLKIKLEWTVHQNTEHTMQVSRV